MTQSPDMKESHMHASTEVRRRCLHIVGQTTQGPAERLHQASALFDEASKIGNAAERDAFLECAAGIYGPWVSGADALHHTRAAFQFVMSADA